MNHEVMPVGTREAMTKAAEFLRQHEAMHREAALVAASVPRQFKSREKAKLFGEHAERLEALLDQPSVERSGQ